MVPGLGRLEALDLEGVNRGLGEGGVSGREGLGFFVGEGSGSVSFSRLFFSLMTWPFSIRMPKKIWSCSEGDISKS